MPRARLPAYLAVAGVLLIVSTIALRGLRGGEAGEDHAPPAPPPEVTLTFNFLGSPNLVFVCWVPSGQDANFTDVKTVIREGEQVREEVRYGVKESDCGGAAGASLYMWQPGFYHYAVRACNDAGCSQWRDAYDDARYWFTIPCADASGAACARRR